MKNVIILFASILLLASCATQPKTALEKEREISVKKVEWFPFEVEGYSIQFPKAPVSQTETAASDLGELETTIFTASGQDAVYALSITEFPIEAVHSSMTEMLNEFYRGGVDGAVGNIQGKLRAETTIELDGFEGRAIQADFTNGEMLLNSRMFIIGNRLYTLQVAHEINKDKSLSINRFFDSFALTEAYKTEVLNYVATPMADNWQLYESVPGAYEIAFPDIPTDERGVDIEDSMMGIVTTYGIASESKQNNVSYIVTYMDIPPDVVPIKEILDSDLEGFYKGVVEGKIRSDEKVLENKKIQLGDVVGREIKMSIVEQDIPKLQKTRVFLVANRMYTLEAITSEADIDALTARFFDSFKVSEAFKIKAREQLKTPEEKWQLYTSELGAYKIIFPGVSTETKEVQDTEIGKLTFHIRSYNSSQYNTVYISGHMDFPNEIIQSDYTTEEIYAGIMEGMTSGSKVKTIKNIKINDIEGHEVIMNIEEQDMVLLATIRIVIVDKRMYMIQTFTPEGNVDTQTNRFFDSFELIK